MVYREHRLRDGAARQGQALPASFGSEAQMRLRRERGKRMKIIKRSGTEVVFDIDKIVNAIRAANLEVEESLSSYRPPGGLRGTKRRRGM